MKIDFKRETSLISLNYQTFLTVVERKALTARERGMTLLMGLTCYSLGPIYRNWNDHIIILFSMCFKKKKYYLVHLLIVKEIV